MRSWSAIALCAFFATSAASAQSIDCPTPIAKAQKSVDKVTGDLQGMDKMMPKEEMSQIRALLGEAEKLLKEAQHHCAKSASPYEEARGIAQADAADGYATAADILHFHYMQAMSNSGMKDMPTGKGATTQDMKSMPSKP